MTLNSEEQIFLEENRKLFDAWNRHDVDAIYEMQKDSIGYGYRDKNLRTNPGEGNQAFFSTLKDFKINVDEEDIRIVGDTGLYWCTYTEKVVELDDSVRYVKGRHTSTWNKKDGKWTYLMFHRDNLFNP